MYSLYRNIYTRMNYTFFTSILLVCSTQMHCIHAIHYTRLKAKRAMILPQRRNDKTYGRAGLLKRSKRIHTIFKNSLTKRKSKNQQNK
jgi:hypothetical protein